MVTLSNNRQIRIADKIELQHKNNSENNRKLHSLKMSVIAIAKQIVELKNKLMAKKHELFSFLSFEELHLYSHYYGDEFYSE